MSDTNQAVVSLNMVRGLKFRIQKEEGLYYPCSENKGADQLRGYREADLRFVFAYAKIRFSHVAAHLLIDSQKTTTKNVIPVAQRLQMQMRYQKWQKCYCIHVYIHYPCYTH